MSLIGISVRVRIKGLVKFQQYFNPPVAEPVRAMYIQWGGRMLGFLKERYAEFSRGGGDWPPLADSTKAARRGPSKRNKGKPRKFSILWNLGKLIEALDPKLEEPPGGLREEIPNGIRVGFGGNARHPAEPGTSGKSLATIADIAGFHQVGGGRLPQRKIIVPPNERTRQGMVIDGNRAIKRMIDLSGANGNES